MKPIAVAFAALLTLSACIDSAGPRPRPGGAATEQPSSEAPEMLWYEIQPRVITQGSQDSVRITVAASGPAESIEINTRSGPTVSLRRGTDGLYSGKLAPSLLLFGYRQSDLHNVVGNIELQGTNQSNAYNLIVNVKDPTVPGVTVQSIAPGIQATQHVVNIRYDDIFSGGTLPTEPIRTFYSQYQDVYTFLAVIEQVQTPVAPLFKPIRNAVRGLGLDLFDNGSAYGSAAALEGVVDYPNDTRFDLAVTDNIHEIAHRWMNYLTVPSLAATRPHWPLSDLAYGVTGRANRTTGALIQFPFEVVPQPNGTFLLIATDAPRSFNDLELYLMGVLPPESVQAHVVFLNSNQASQIRDGGILSGPVDSVTIATIVARDGARTPAYGAAQTTFRIATIVLSRGRLLAQDEMAYFEHMALRGEQTTALPFFTGLLRGTTLPFRLATGGRATLITTLGPR